MNDLINSSAYFGVLISVGSYGIASVLRQKTKLTILNPLLIAIILVMLFLIVFDVSYESYNQSAKYLSYLLTPATVCLSVPLYRQLTVLKKNFAAVIIGLASGVLSSLISVYLLAKLLGLSQEMYITLLPKSVTTAIGMEVASELGGDGGLAAAAIIVTGLIGNMAASGLCKLLRLKHPIAVGLAIGCSAHAMGTSRALEIGEIEGAMSSLAVAVAGLITVIFAPIAAGIPL